MPLSQVIHGIFHSYFLATQNTANVTSQLLRTLYSGSYENLDAVLTLFIENSELVRTNNSFVDTLVTRSYCRQNDRPP